MHPITHCNPGCLAVRHPGIATSPIMKLRSALTALCLALVTVPALASDDCEVPMQRWQSRDAVRQHAASQGWQVRRLKIDDGCYEIRGRDAQGRAFKAKLDPETLSVVKIKFNNHDRNRDRERRRQGSGSQSQPAASAPGASPILTPGGTPRGQIE